MTPLRSVLIIRLSAIGDVIHALPLLEALRRLLPEARIGWLLEELPAPLLESHPELDTVYTIPKKRWRRGGSLMLSREAVPFFRRLRKDGWDATVDLQGIFKSGLASRLSGARLRVGFRGENSREGNGLFMTRRIRPRAGDRHVVQQNLRLLEGLGLEPPANPPRGSMSIRSEEQDALRARLEQAGWGGEPLLGVNAGAGFASKLWGADRYASLTQRLCDYTGFRPLAFWGPGEEPLRDSIVERLRDHGAIPAPPTTVRESAVLISLCSLFLSGDTGPAHMAGLLGVPVITIFGATDGSRNCPWPAHGPNPAGIYVQREDLACVPCRKRTCPLHGKDHLACLSGLDAGEVYDRIEPWLRLRFPSRAV